MEEQAKIDLYVDGGARGNPGPAAGAYVILNSDENIISSEGFFLGKTTNNVAEYSALLRGLAAVQDLKIKEINIFSDSELVVKQIIGKYRVKNSDLKEIYLQVQQALLSFDRWQIRHIPREMNKQADSLVNEVLDDKLNAPKQVNQSTEPASSTKVMLEVLNPPSEGTCASEMKRGMCFVFSEVVPPGLCICAANSVLPSVIAIRRSPSDYEDTLQIRCERPECGAIFKISKI